VADVLFRDDPSEFKDEDTQFDEHELVSLVVADGYTAQTADDLTLTPIFVTYDLTVENAYSFNAADTPTIPDTTGPADTYFRDEDTSWKDESDTIFYPHDVSLLTLGVDNGYSINSASDIFLDYLTYIVAYDAYNVNSADTPAIVYDVNLTAADSSHVNAADSAQITLEYYQFTDNSYHLQAAGDVVLTLSEYITTEDSSHANVSGDPLPFQEHVLALESGAQSIVSDDVTIGQTGEDVLSPDYAYNVNAADTVELSQEYEISADSSYIANVSDDAGITETGSLMLILSDGYSDHLADDVTVSEGLNLATEDSVIINIPDDLLLYQEYVANSLDSFHPNIGEDIVLSVEQLLALEDAYNRNRSDSPGLLYLALGAVVDPYIISLTAKYSLASLTTRYSIREK
jgi:hypothetical protein